jgi:hypothetical protein
MLHLIWKEPSRRAIRRDSAARNPLLWAIFILVGGWVGFAVAYGSIGSRPAQMAAVAPAKPSDVAMPSVPSLRNVPVATIAATPAPSFVGRSSIAVATTGAVEQPPAVESIAPVKKARKAASKRKRSTNVTVASDDTSRRPRSTIDLF